MPPRTPKKDAPIERPAKAQPKRRKANRVVLWQRQVQPNKEPIPPPAVRDGAALSSEIG